MATIKDTVASHISTNWNGAVVCGSGAIPTIDAVGPEDIPQTRDYDEAVLVYNERKIVKKRFNQNLYENRVYSVPITIRLTQEAANTKTIMDNCRTELERIFGVQVSGFDPGQYFDGPNNLTMGKGLYEARYTLFLPQYGVSVSAAWTAVGVTTGYGHVIPAADGTYDLGTTLLRWRYLYADSLELTNPLADSEVADDITLTNITQITTRKMDDLQAPDATVDCGGQKLDNVASIQNGSTISMMANDDTSDYLQFLTAGDVPSLKVIGGAQMRIESDHATIVDSILYDDATHYIILRFHKTSHFALFRCTGDIQFQADGDTNDYFYFSTAANIPYLYCTDDKVAIIGAPANSLDHVYSDDFDNTSPFEKFAKPLDELKKIKDKKDKDGKDKLDYASMPDFVRSHTRDPKKDKIETYIDDDGNEQERVIERAPKDVIAEEGWSINRMVVLLYQAVQELTTQFEEYKEAHP